MCGICGVVWTDRERASAPGLIDRMTERLTHRGPDGAGTHEEPGVSLGHRRLSIIDVAGGAQPMANEDGSVLVVFNGEIYNHAELRRRLEACGHRFQTRSDTEALVHLYEEDGDAMVDSLRGMFAFAIWDRRRRRLLLARDRLGQKPLVYRHDTDGLRFASELKSLVVEPGFPRDIDPMALDEYLAYQYVPHPRTIFQAVRKLPPAHLAVYEEGRLEVRRYWRPPYDVEVRRPAGEFIEELREKLTESVRLRLMSDVPLGAFLSGGIDSTIIVGLMARLSNTRVRTFSIGFPVPEFDESRYARMAADRIGTEHEEFIVEPNAIEIVPKLAWHYDEPFADSSAVPTYYVSQRTRQHVTVALSGDGGDELFAGYLRYRAVRIGAWFDRLPGPLRRFITAEAWQRLPGPDSQRSTVRRLKRLLRHLGDPPMTRYRQWIEIFDSQRRQQLYSRDFAAHLAGHDAADWLESLYAELPNRDFVTRTTYVDLVGYLPLALMTKVDIASMANGLECRGPFLDHEVVALAGRMPIGMKLRGRCAKWVLKEAFPEFLPPTLRDRPKMGFGVPIDHWMRDEMAPMLRDLLGSERFRQRGWFDPQQVDRLIEEHVERKWDHAYRLWALLMLELWARNYLDAV